jgi:murein L,D-transpeptidase YafK
VKYEVCLRHLVALILALVLVTAATGLSAATVEERLEQYGPAVRQRLRPLFANAGVSYPPSELTLVGLKHEGRLLIYAAEAGGPHRFIRAYPILAASGGLGPKLRQGDRQVPEGFYRVELLNANSSYHLSLRLNYPNTFDRRMASADGRTNLGGDIMIHGNSVSIGCLAMGDAAAEDLFVLAADTGLSRIEVILAPVDLRSQELQLPPTVPAWVSDLYREIKDALEPLPTPEPLPAGQPR